MNIGNVRHGLTDGASELEKRQAIQLWIVTGDGLLGELAKAIEVLEIARDNPYVKPGHARMEIFRIMREIADAATEAESFAGGEIIRAVQACGDRVIVARPTPDLENPAEIAYSDDDGATWTSVNVGSVNAQVINDLYWLDWTHLWAVATGGYVYFSDDGGESWSAQSSGGLTTEDLNAVHAIDQTHVWAVGDNGVIIKAKDGSTWQTVTRAFSSPKVERVE